MTENLLNELENFMILNGERNLKKEKQEAVYSLYIKNYEIDYIKSAFIDDEVLKIRKNGKIIFLKGVFNNVIEKQINKSEVSIKDTLSKTYFFGIPVSNPMAKARGF